MGLAGNDVLNGGPGNDKLVGGKGADKLRCGAARTRPSPTRRTRWALIVKSSRGCRPKRRPLLPLRLLHRRRQRRTGKWSLLRIHESGQEHLLRRHPGRRSSRELRHDLGRHVRERRDQRPRALVQRLDADPGGPHLLVYLQRGLQTGSGSALTNVTTSYTVNGKLDTAGNATGMLTLTRFSFDYQGTHYDCSAAPYGWQAKVNA